MTEYKRLTHKNWHDTKFGQLNSREVLYKLWQLENQIENGTLVQLPCKVGDTVWFVYETENDTMVIDEGTVQDFSYGEAGLWFGTLYEHLSSYWQTALSIGKTVFLTRAEAEAKLEQLKKGQDQ